MNAHEEPAARMQVTLRLERDLLDRIDAVAADEGIDRTELARRLLSQGLARHQADLAVADYAAGRRSAWSAASRAGIDLYEMLDRIADAGVPYRMDPEVIDRLRARFMRRPGGGGAGNPPTAGEAGIDRQREQHRPDRTRVLMVGESSPAGGTHFYHADSILFRATTEAFGSAYDPVRVPEGPAFLEWFASLGCWLVDMADRPVDDLEAASRSALVRAGIPRLVDLILDTRPERVVVVIRRVAPAVREAAALAGFAASAIDVVPFPIRQWRPVYVRQLAAIIRDVLVDPVPAVATTAVAEPHATYGSPGLHEVMADVLGRHAGVWVKASAIAREIARDDLWRRPSDRAHPRGSQISARARQYPALFQVGDLGIRLRGS